MMGFDYKGVYFLADMRAGLPVWSQYKITTYANRIILDEKTIDYYSDMPNHWLYADASACKDQLHLNFNPQVSAELGFNMDKWLAYHPRHKRSPTRKPQDRELVHYELAAYANVGCITDYKTCHNEPLLTYNPVRSVKQELMNRGVESSRIKTIGRGQTEPVATNETEEGKQLNRRVEMTFDVLEE